MKKELQKGVRMSLNSLPNSNYEIALLFELTVPKFELEFGIHPLWVISEIFKLQSTCLTL